MAVAQLTKTSLRNGIFSLVLTYLIEKLKENSHAGLTERCYL